LRSPLRAGVHAMTDRLCAFCGKDISAKRPDAIYCCRRCRHWQKRGGVPPDRARERTGAMVARWYDFRIVAGPCGAGSAFHCATLTDRDPKTGVSAYEEIESRNARRLSQKPPA
jgi:hypothetical protein